MSNRATAFAVTLIALLPVAGSARRKPLPAGLQHAGQVTAIRYNVNLIREGTPTRLDNGSELAWKDTVQTDGNGRVLLRLASDTSISLGEDSELNMVGPSDALEDTVLQFHHGMMRAKSSAPLVVRTATAVARGNGSDFAVDASLPDRVKFVCLQGTTVISTTETSAGEIECEAGNSVTVKNGSLPRDTRIADDAQLALWRNITDPEEPAPYRPFP